MRTIMVMAAGLLLVARAAHGECVFHNDYYAPEVQGVCTAETSVPEGCAVHVVTPAGAPPTFAVYRGAQIVDVTSTVTLIDTLTVPMPRIDLFDCGCAYVDGAGSFDRSEIVVAGALAGDTVEFDAANATAVIAIGPAGPCPAPAWPTEYTIATRCDRCPDPTDTPDADRGGGGCATSGDGGLLMVVLAGLAMLSRGRSR